MGLFGVSADLRADDNMEETMAKKSDDFAPETINHSAYDDQDEAMVAASNVLTTGKGQSDDEDASEDESTSDDEGPQGVASFDEGPEHVFRLEEGDEDDAF